MSLIFNYIILGIVQGLTEPLPISSSGHVMIIHNLLKSSIDVELLAVITNFGSLIAICFLYRNKLLKLIKGFFSYFKNETKDNKQSFRYSLLLIIATIPAGLMGLIVSITDVFDVLEKNIKFVGITLLITSVFLFLIRNIKGTKEEKNITLKDAIIIGLFQVVALLPGISRSGATITGAMFRDLRRDVAFDFSFMLYIPISFATMILGIKDLIKCNLDFANTIFYLMAAVLAGVITYYATKWFKNLVKNGKLIYFSIYCLIVGLLIIIFL